MTSYAEGPRESISTALAALLIAGGMSFGLFLELWWSQSGMTDPRSAMYAVSLCASVGGLCAALVCVIVAMHAAIGSLTKAACLVFFVPWGCFATWAWWQAVTGSFFRGSRPGLLSADDAVEPVIVLGVCVVAVVVFRVFLPRPPRPLGALGQRLGRR